MADAASVGRDIYIVKIFLRFLGGSEAKDRRAVLRAETDAGSIRHGVHQHGGGPPHNNGLPYFAGELDQAAVAWLESVF